MHGARTSSRRCKPEAMTSSMPFSSSMASPRTPTSRKSTALRQPKCVGRHHQVTASTSHHSQYYREKLRAAVEGRAYTPPPPSSVPPRPSSSASARRPARANNDDWDDWGSNPRPRGSQSSPNLQAQAGNEYTLGQLEASAKNKEAFFQNKIAVCLWMMGLMSKCVASLCRRMHHVQRACTPVRAASMWALGPPHPLPHAGLAVWTL